ncbi:MAG: zinc-ribbon and FHA domain-containing protein [Acidimicrobiales bacterium]|nr:zinc-ribbon and FHA domain-containing protein [Acidimicrobiales bacterium]
MTENEPAPEILCPRCGHHNHDVANFCSSCGTILRALADEPTAAHPMPLADDAPRAGFLVRRGPKAGSRFELEDGITTLGRHPDSDIFLDDITVSRRHAEVRRTVEGYSVRDVGSLNGSYLNRSRIDEADLADGDELQIGMFKLVFFSGDAG